MIVHYQGLLCQRVSLALCLVVYVSVHVCVVGGGSSSSLTVSISVRHSLVNRITNLAPCYLCVLCIYSTFCSESGVAQSSLTARLALSLCLCLYYRHITQTCIVQ